MKKPIIPPASGIFLAVLLLLTIAFITNSCRKENKLTAQQVNAEIAAQQFPVKDAMAWFTGNKATLATRIKLNSDLLFLSKIADFTPVWDSARTAVDTNYYVVEAPAKYVRRLGFATDSNGVNINGTTRLLVLKSKKYGGLSAVLMHIHGDAGANINKAHYMDLPQGFSGNIFYTSIQGGFINGYIYKNGKIVMVSAGNNSGVKPAGPQILQEYIPGYCVETTTDWYTNTCYWESDGSLERCTEWVYDHTTVETYCVPGQYIGGGGGVAPPDCPPGGGGNPPVEALSVKGKLIVNLVAPPPDGGDGGDNPCAPPPQPDTVKKKKKDPCAEKTSLNAIASNSIVSAILNKVGSYSDVKEYGANMNVTNWNGANAGSNFVNTNVSTNYDGSHWRPTYTWNPTDGFYIGYSHGHPEGDAPAPADVFNFLDPLTLNRDMVTAGADAIQYYKDHAFGTTETTNGSYIVTINDWEAFTNLWVSSYSTIAQMKDFVTDYKSKASDYLDNNFGANLADAGAFALIEKFGDAINVYHADLHSTTYTPLTTGVDTDGKKKLKAVPCPPVQ